MPSCAAPEPPTRSAETLESPRRKRRRWPLRALIVLAAVVALLAICVVAFLVDASHPYPAHQDAAAALAGVASGDAAAGAGGDASGPVAVREDDDAIAIGSPSSEFGLVLYPGAKVDPHAYAPLACDLAERGVYCVIAKMPFNYAFFDIDAAEDLMEDAPDIAHWWVGGHSLGGAMAAQYAADEPRGIEGVALLASYAASDLTRTGLDALVIYGSNDGVLNRDKLAANEANLPAGAQTLIIDGGNHAGFGDYGPQSGDGQATIDASEQQARTADAIANAMRQTSARR